MNKGCERQELRKAFDVCLTV